MQSNISIDFEAKSKRGRPPRSHYNAHKSQKSTPTEEQPALDPSQSSVFIKSDEVSISTIKKTQDHVKIIPLGWLEEIWSNMTLVEYGDDMVIVDAGMLFPGGEQYGIDYLIPDISYVKKNIRKLKWVLITHGHLDHIWALKHVLPELNRPMVYGSPLAIWLIKKSLEEMKLTKYFKYRIVNPDTDLIKLWVFTTEFFRVNHNIPETMWLAMHSPKWLIVFTWDFKIDFTPAIDKPADIAKIARLWQEWVKVLLCESTNAIKPGRTPSEKTIWDNLEMLIREAKWRLIVATFASNVWRIIQLIHSAVKYNRVVFLAWRSMINYVDIAKELWYINVPPQMIRKMPADAESMPDDRVMILCTWSQWEEHSALQRISKWEYPYFKLRKGDRILASASPIPWNEKSFYTMVNDLVKNDVDIVTHADLDIHASWHWYAEDIKMMISLFKPEYLIPIHGEPRLRAANKKLGIEVGVARENVMMIDNWSIVEVYDQWAAVAEQWLKLDTVMIDWYGIWHSTWEFVLKARKIMSENGIVNLTFKIDSKTKNLVWNIQIESRGFVYSTEVKTVHTDIVRFVERRYSDLRKRLEDVKEILKVIKTDLEQHLNKTLDRIPMIIPMFVYINDSRGLEDENSNAQDNSNAQENPQDNIESQENTSAPTQIMDESGAL